MQIKKGEYEINKTWIVDKICRNKTGFHDKNINDIRITSSNLKDVLICQIMVKSEYVSDNGKSILLEESEGWNSPSDPYQSLYIYYNGKEIVKYDIDNIIKCSIDLINKGL